MALVLGLSLTACGDTSDEPSSGGDPSAKKESSQVANKDKPLVWFNRQPSNSSTSLT